MNQMSESSLLDYLTVAQVVVLKRVTAAAVYRAIKENRLFAERVLNRWAIKHDVAVAWNPQGYKDRMGPKRRGRRLGSTLSADTRLKMSESARRSWLKRKNESG